MITGLIAIGGTVLGIILGFVLGINASGKNTTVIEPKPKLKLPECFQVDHAIDTITYRRSFSPGYIIDNDESAMKIVNDGLLNELRTNLLQYASYVNYDDPRYNKIIVEADIRVVKNNIGGE